MTTPGPAEILRRALLAASSGPTGILLNQTAPFFVAVTGHLTAHAGTVVYAQGTSGDLQLDNVSTTTGVVDLATRAPDARRWLPSLPASRRRGGHARRTRPD